MTQFTRANGDFLPVINYDSPEYTNSGVNAVSSGVTVQPQGPKLAFFTVTADGALSTTQVNILVQTVQQLSTIYMYEYTDTTNDTVALALYPVSAWTTSAMKTAIENAFTAQSVSNTVTVTATATFTN